MVNPNPATKKLGAKTGGTKTNGLEDGKNITKENQETVTNQTDEDGKERRHQNSSETTKKTSRQENQATSNTVSEGTPIKRVKLTFGSPIGGMVSRSKTVVQKNTVYLHYEMHNCGAFRAWLQKRNIEEEAFWNPTKVVLTDNNKSGEDMRELFQVMEVLPRRCPNTGRELPQAQSGYSHNFTWSQFLFYPPDDSMTIEQWATNLVEKIDGHFINPIYDYRYGQRLQLGTDYTNKKHPTKIQTALLDKHVLEIMRNVYKCMEEPDKLNKLSDDEVMVFFTSVTSARSVIEAFLHRVQNYQNVAA